MIVGGSSSRVTKLPSAEDISVVESLSAPSHDGSLDREGELAALKVKLEAIELADERRQTKLEALELADERRQAKLEALEIADERRQAEFEALQSDNKALLDEVSGCPHCRHCCMYLVKRALGVTVTNVLVFFLKR